MKLKITLVKSPIASLPKHKATVAALGLRKVRSEEHTSELQSRI